MKQNKFYQIKNITEYEYTLVCCDGSVITRPIQDVDKSASAFTIQDAKDGDVLACNEEILLFKSYSVQGRISLYCWYNGQTNHFHSKEVNDTSLTTRNKIYPATKEQYDTLFAKMKEAGYKWNAENKEFEEIDNEESNGEDYGIDSLYHAQRILEKTLGKVDGYQTDDGILAHQCAISAVKKLYEQNPTWSEEDERSIRDSIFYLKSAKKYFEKDDDILWDEKWFNLCIEWLESLKDRVLPQQERSGEDNKIISEVVQNYESGFLPSVIERDRIVKTLKSLKPQNTWKPSKGQLECLGYAIEKAEKDWPPLINNRIYLTLKALKEQLEKI